MEDECFKIYNGHKLSTVTLDAGGKKIVIFCHGYRSTSIGPNRLFVEAARKLGKKGISSLRFDQYGSGNSQGDFKDSSFDDWVATTEAITQDYLNKGYQVVLFGQSMGGATVLAIGSKLAKLSGIVSWVPDPSVEKYTPPPSGIFEEGGQIIRASYWQEAHDAHIAEKLQKVSMPAYIVQASDDQYVSEENHQAIVDNAQPQHHVEMFEGYSHSSWSYKQANDILNKSIKFIEDFFA